MVVAVGSPSGTEAVPANLDEDLVGMLVAGLPTNFQPADEAPRSNEIQG